MMKTLLIIGAIILAGFLIQKVVWPAIKGLLKLAGAIVIPAILVGVVIVVIFFGAAMVSGQAEQVEGGDIVTEKIDEQFDSLEQKGWYQKADKKVREWQEKHQ